MKHVINTKSKLKCNLFLLPKYIKKIMPDYVLYPAFPPSMFSNFRNTKIISVIHDLVCWDCGKTMKFKSRLYFKQGIKFALKKSHIIVTNSNFTKARIIDRFNYPYDRILVAPCSSNIKLENVKDSLDVLKKYNLNTDAFFLTLSTIEPRKNLNFLIKVYDKLCLENMDVPDFVFVGRKGWKMDRILDDVSKTTLSKIHFTGFVDDADLPVIYEACSCFIFASMYEGFGIPVLEAIRMKKNVIVSDIASNRELVGDDYIYKFSFSYDSFKKCVNLFLNNDKKINDNLIDALLIKNEKYDWTKSAEIINNIFKSN